MMYMHYCSNCRFIHMLNGHKFFCPRCEQRLTELRITYLEYAGLSRVERQQLTERCSKPEGLIELGTTYQMFKYSKWYRTLQTTSPAAIRDISTTGKRIAVG